MMSPHALSMAPGLGLGGELWLLLRLGRPDAGTSRHLAQPALAVRRRVTDGAELGDVGEIGQNRKQKEIGCRRRVAGEIAALSELAVEDRHHVARLVEVLLLHLGGHWQEAE